MTWTKRELASDLVILGDAEGQVAKAGGLLASVVPDPRYPDNRRYELVQQNGESRWVAGSAAINCQIGPADVGKFVKLVFNGWATGGRSRYKDIEVHVWEGELTPQMKNWPRYAELQDGASYETADFSDIADEGDDLPF